VSRNYQNKQKFPEGDSTELCLCVLQLEQVHARSEHYVFSNICYACKWLARWFFLAWISETSYSRI